MPEQCKRCQTEIRVGPYCDKCSQHNQWVDAAYTASGLRNGIHSELGEIEAPGITAWAGAFTFDDRKCPEASNAAAKARLVVNGDLRMLVILGPRGTGKTQLAAGIIFDGLRAEKTGVIVSTWDCLCEIRSNRSLSVAREKQLRARKRFMDPDILVLDEFQVRGGDQREAAELVTLVDERYRTRGKATVMVANLEPDAFVDYAGDSITDRVRQLGGKIVCEWKSFRGDQS